MQHTRGEPVRDPSHGSKSSTTPTAVMGSDGPSNDSNEALHTTGNTKGEIYIDNTKTSGYGSTAANCRVYAVEGEEEEGALASTAATFASTSTSSVQHRLNEWSAVTREEISLESDAAVHPSQLGTQSRRPHKELEGEGDETTLALSDLAEFRRNQERQYKLAIVIGEWREKLLMLTAEERRYYKNKRLRLRQRYHRRLTESSRTRRCRRRRKLTAEEAAERHARRSRLMQERYRRLSPAKLEALLRRAVGMARWPLPSVVSDSESQEDERTVPARGGGGDSQLSGMAAVSAVAAVLSLVDEVVEGFKRISTAGSPEENSAAAVRLSVETGSYISRC